MPVHHSRLQNKSVVVTGSTRGLGEAMVRLFAAEGARVVVTGRDDSSGRLIEREIRENGGTAVFVRSEMTDETSVRHLVDTTVGEYGRIDALVNNAMATDLIGPMERPVAEMDSAGFDQILKVGIYGVFWACKHAIPEMLKVGGGSIVNISSVAAVAGVASMPAYSACKGALGALGRQMATDYGPQGIRVNTIVCGLILADGLTSLIEQHPVVGPAMAEAQLTRYGTHEDIANLASYLVSDESAFMTGADVRLDGGWTSAARIPNIIDAISGAPVS